MFNKKTFSRTFSRDNTLRRSTCARLTFIKSYVQARETYYKRQNNGMITGKQEQVDLVWSKRQIELAMKVELRNSIFQNNFNACQVGFISICAE